MHDERVLLYLLSTIGKNVTLQVEGKGETIFWEGSSLNFTYSISYQCPLMSHILLTFPFYTFASSPAQQHHNIIIMNECNDAPLHSRWTKRKRVRKCTSKVCGATHPSINAMLQYLGDVAEFLYFILLSATTTIIKKFSSFL